MPAERINVTFEPRPLEVLYSKYGPEPPHHRHNNNNNNSRHHHHHHNGTTTGVASTTTAAAGVPTLRNGCSKAFPPGGRRRGPDAPPRLPLPTARRQELGDLKKLGRELTKVERVEMLFDLPGGKGKARSRSQPNSAANLKVRCLNAKAATCNQCSEEHKREEGQSRLRNLKSKLRLVAARSLPDCGQSSHSPSSPVRHSSQHVVSLPLLQINCQRNATSSEDFAALRDVRKSLRNMLFPTPGLSKRAAAVWNYHFASGSRGDANRDLLRKDCLVEGSAVSKDASPFQMLLPLAGVAGGSGSGGGGGGGGGGGVLLNPACSPADEVFDETKTASTFDADRVDSEQFEYVFDNFSESSSGSASGSSLTYESSTATISARAQRPSTTDSVATPQRLVETRASGAALPLSPISPGRRGARGGAGAGGGESWPPQYTVVPSWPSLDDPYRFQYLGCGVHRDFMRRLHRSRGRKRAGKRGGDSEQQQQPPPPPEPQKLKVVVPSHTTCALCNSAHDCFCHGSGGGGGGGGPLSAHNTRTASPSHQTSLAGKSTRSRDSLSMSVCTVLSRRTQPRPPASSAAGGADGRGQGGGDVASSSLRERRESSDRNEDRDLAQAAAAVKQR